MIHAGFALWGILFKLRHYV